MRLSPALAAGIFDLDGVLTRTARVHAAAWKQVFDALLARQQPPQPPFDAARDYLEHVDGKPRLDGARDFLAARGIALPQGDEGDAPGLQTLHALGASKNQAFHEVLARDGVEAHPGAAALLRALRDGGRRTAVVSSSRNARAVLDAAALAPLLDTVVDGTDAARQRLRGKPAPDLFVEAARRLGVAPARGFVVEDARSGVAAARSGGFGLVVGMAGRGAAQAEALRVHGADLVCQELSELTVVNDPCPPALEHLDEIAARLGRGRPAIFLDYDGTLTPIVDRPQDALLDPPMREVLGALAARVPLAVVSGRDLGDVRDRVGVASAYYAGSHGFDIAGPNGERHQHPQAQARTAALDAAQAMLQARLFKVQGALVERKTFSLAVHDRLVADADLPRVREAVAAAQVANKGLRVQVGKRVHDFQPDLPWHKGHAVRWLMQAIDGRAAQPGGGQTGSAGAAAGGAARTERLVPLYIGDDVTDEDAFETLAADGVTVAVLDAPRPTAAQYRLGSADEVRQLLNALARRLAPGADEG